MWDATCGSTINFARLSFATVSIVPSCPSGQRSNIKFPSLLSTNHGKQLSQLLWISTQFSYCELGDHRRVVTSGTVAVWTRAVCPRQSGFSKSAPCGSKLVTAEPFRTIAAIWSGGVSTRKLFSLINCLQSADWENWDNGNFKTPSERMATSYNVDPLGLNEEILHVLCVRIGHACEIRCVSKAMWTAVPQTLYAIFTQIFRCWMTVRITPGLF